MGRKPSSDAALRNPITSIAGWPRRRAEQRDEIAAPDTKCHLIPPA